MSEIKLKGQIHKVVITEYERGWGQKEFDKKFFETEQEARAFCQQYNSQNTAPEAPDYYIQASYIGKIS